MENKYYTPDISEFYVGFEYEAEDLHDNLIDRCWRKETLEAQDELIVRKSWIDNGEIRVKYLDKEDIESLGFKQLKTPAWFHKEGVSLFNSGVYDLRICLWPREDNIRITISYPGVEDEQIFVGRCKNKSELKMALKMIGYDYNS